MTASSASDLQPTRPRISCVHVYFMVYLTRVRSKDRALPYAVIHPQLRR